MSSDHATGIPSADTDAMKCETDIKDAALLSRYDRLYRKGTDEHSTLNDIRIFLESHKTNNILAKSK